MTCSLDYGTKQRSIVHDDHRLGDAPVQEIIAKQRIGRIGIFKRSYYTILYTMIFFFNPMALPISTVYKIMQVTLCFVWSDLRTDVNSYMIIVLVDVLIVFKQSNYSAGLPLVIQLALTSSYNCFKIHLRGYHVILSSTQHCWHWNSCNDFNEI